MHALRTERLDLEPAEARHGDIAFDAFDDERMWRYFPHLRPRDADELAERFARWRTGPPQNNPIFTGWENWVARLHDGRVAGLFQATHMRGDASLIAYSIVPPLWRQGYAREGVAAVIDHLVVDHGILHIFADISRENEASIALVQSLGFVQVSSGDEPRFALRCGSAVQHVEGTV